MREVMTVQSKRECSAKRKKIYIYIDCILKDYDDDGNRNDF